MVLTWPIDKVDPSEIPAFQPIYDAYQHVVPDLGGMLRFLCYRFDPKARDGREKDSVTKKAEDSAIMAGWKPPVPDLEETVDGAKEVSLAYTIYSEVVGLFFSILDNDEWEFIESLDIAIHNANMIIREPIVADDPEVKGKILLNVQKAIKGNEDAIVLRKGLAMKMADSDPAAAKSIMESTKSARRPTSPEKFLLNG